MDEYLLPNCCYDYRFDNYEDGKIISNNDVLSELEDRMCEDRED